jgi:hypothetical protein
MFQPDFIQIGFFASSRTICACGHRYAHVELRFSDYTSTSITRSPGVVHVLQGKKMSSPNYRCFFQISVSPAVEEEMMDFANSCTEQFSLVAMYWNFVPVLRRWPIRNRGTFCSAYVCKLLQIAGYCHGLDPYLTSPDALFEELAADDRVVCSRNRQA